jgi:microcystin-dependent protein
MSGLINWSTDASSNDTADPPTLWQEGQPAATVNNSARAMMAGLAKWRDDNSGALVATRGANDAYSVTTNQTLTTTTIGGVHTLAFTVNAANQGPVTLFPDSLTGAPILRSGGIPLGPGDLQPGTIYRVARLGSNYFLTSSGVECGTVSAFASPSIPSGWLACDGSAVSRAAYAALFLRIGGYYGNGDGSTTFNLPDLRGRTLFGVDAGAGRLTGSGGLGGGLASTGGAEVVALSEAQLASHSHGGSTAGAGAHDHGGATGQSGAHDHGAATGTAGNHSHSGTTNNGGGHTHSGSTNSAGAHSHGIQYLRTLNYRTDAASGGVNALNAGDASGTNTTGITDGNGTHSHSLSIDGVGDHQHGFNTAAAGDHAHTITAVGNHAHSIGAVADHTHGLSISAAGSGAGHPNIPPSLVVTFAIKT